MPPGTGGADREAKRAERKTKKPDPKKAEMKKVCKPGLVNPKLHDDRASMKHTKKALAGHGNRGLIPDVTTTM
jgi:hypothetical protein